MKGPWAKVKAAAQQWAKALGVAAAILVVCGAVDAVVLSPPAQPGVGVSRRGGGGEPWGTLRRIEMEQGKAKEVRHGKVSR